MFSCPLCSSAHVTLDLGGKLYCCERCDLVFKDPGIWPQQHVEKARYEVHENSLGDTAYVAMLESFISETVIPFVPPGGQGIDFGSGPTPVLSELLKRKGFAMQVYDPYFAPDPRPLSLNYDFITCTEVAEHVHQPTSMWSAFGKLVKPDGVIAMSTHLHSGLAGARQWWYVRDITHVLFYSLSTFRYVADTWGLEIVHTDGTRTIVLKVKS